MIRSYGYIYDAATLTRTATYDTATWYSDSNITAFPLSDSIDLDTNSFIDYGVTQNTHNFVANVVSNAGAALRSYTIDSAAYGAYSFVRSDAQLLANGHVAFLYERSNGDVVLTDLNPATGAVSTPTEVKTLGTGQAWTMRMVTLSNGDMMLDIDSSLYRYDANFNLLATMGKPESTAILAECTKIAALADGGYVVEFAAHPTVQQNSGGNYTSYGIYLQAYDKFNNKNGAEILLRASGNDPYDAYYGNDVGLTGLNAGGVVATYATGAYGREVSMKVFNATSEPMVIKQSGGSNDCANQLSVQLQDVLEMAGENVFNAGNTTLVSGAALGDALDTVHMGSDWTVSGSVVQSAGHTFAVYTSTSGAAQLLIEQAIVNAHHVVM
jgi:hypothetical protein